MAAIPNMAEWRPFPCGAGEGTKLKPATCQLLRKLAEVLCRQGLSRHAEAGALLDEAASLRPEGRIATGGSRIVEAARRRRVAPSTTIRTSGAAQVLRRYAFFQR